MRCKANTSAKGKAATGSLPFGVGRYAPVRRLVQATEFSDDHAIADPVEVIRMIKAFPGVHGQLLRIGEPAVRGGRHRKPGDWVLVYLAFVLSGTPNIEDFYVTHRSSLLWREAGFGDWLPAYPTVYLRLTELEPRARQFVELAHHLIKRAREHEREVGRVVFWDGTAAETHAVPEHACHDKVACKAAKKRARKHLQRASRDQAQLLHETEDALPEDQAPGSKITWLDDTALQAEGFNPKDPDIAAFRWFRQGGHLYRLRDTTAGIRTYEKGSGAPKTWCGWLEFKGYDYFTGAPLAITMDAAGTQEMDLFFSIADDVKRATGHHPHIVSGDRGLHFKPFFEWNTERGIGTALPWRQPTAGREREHMECDRFDRHGVLRCPHCGGPAETRGDGLGFYTDGRGTQRVRGACLQRNTAKCSKLFSVRCDVEPRFIGPYNLLDSTYHEVREAHNNFERTHHHQRTRYATGGQEVLTRAHRVGVAWQMLRCSAAMFLEWFRLCVRHGWLASPRAPKTKRNPIRHFLMGDGGRLKNVVAARRALRLHLPYGAAAIAAGLGRHGPPGQAGP